MRSFFLLPLAALLAGAVRPAVAAPLTAVFTINASGFVDVLGAATPPADPAGLTVRLAFDPSTGNQFDNTAGLTLLGSTIPVAGGLAFDYDSVADTLTFGGAGLGGIGITAGTNDLLAVVDTPYTGMATLAGLEYVSAAAPGSLFIATAGSVGVPEPATAAVVFGSLLGLALVRRRG